MLRKIQIQMHKYEYAFVSNRGSAFFWYSSQASSKNYVSTWSIEYVEICGNEKQHKFTKYFKVFGNSMKEKLPNMSREN